MNQRSAVLSILALLGAGAACQTSLGGMLGPKRGGDERTDEVRDGSSGSSDEQPVPAVPVVKSDLCKYDERASPEENDRRRDVADHTTICTELAVVAPAAGAERIAARAPGWCGLLAEEDLAEARPDWAPSRVATLEGGYWWDGTPDILGALCASPDDPAVQQQTAYFYQWWVNRTGLPTDQLDGLFRYFVSYPSKDLDLYETTLEAACKAFPRASEEASARDQQLRRAERASLGCGESSPYWVNVGGSEDIAWHVDAAAEPPSELLRSYLVLSCLGNPDTIEDRDLAAYATCGTDARALDAAKLDQETASYHELARAHARMQLAAARKVAARYEEVAQAKVAEDPAWQALLYDAPARGWSAWTALYKANKKPIDAARAYEKLYFGPSRKAAKGCWAGAWANLEAHVAAKQASTLLDAKHAMTDTVGTMILEHLVACSEAEGEALISTYFGQLFEHGRPARGPRYAALYAIIDALQEIKADRAKFPAEVAWFSQMFTSRSPLSHGGGDDVASLDLAREDQGGVVKSVAKAGDGAVVEFKTERWKEGAYACTTTNRILMFERDGTPIYERDCVYQGQHWVEQTHDSIWIPAVLAATIKPGSFVRAATSANRHGDAWDAIPVEVWADKEREKLTAYLGVAL